MRLGILGGTFDPVHLGHLILASEAIYQLELTKVYFVLTPYPPHKVGLPITDLQHRFEMLRYAIEDNPLFEISKIDIDREPPHFAADTMELLKTENPEDALIYLMGGDSLRDLPTWKHPQRFVANCDELGVMKRDVDSIDLNALEEEIAGISSKVRWLNAARFEISSREIRRRVAENMPFRYFVPDKVHQYIIDRRLYASGGE